MVRIPGTVRGRWLIVAALLLLGALVALTPVFVLTMAPAIALFAMVANRLMPGEARFVRALQRHRCARPRPVRSLPVYDVLVVRRAGRLIAAALAMRPPPALRPITS